MKSLKKIWEHIVSSLSQYERREAENIAFMLLEDLFDASKSDILVDRQIAIDSERIDEVIDRLKKHEPLQYVTGVADFFGRKFKVSPDVLIPRPETEELVQLIKDDSDSNSQKILDVGTGSGCIAITLALEVKCEVSAIDISPSAISIAEKNSATLGAKVSFSTQDIFDDLTFDPFDSVVSNPPYIPISEKRQMRENVVGFEPELALFVSENDPLIFYKRVADLGVSGLLKANGKLFFEIHESFGEEVAKYLTKVGYQQVRIHKDLQGKDRMISATNSASK